MKKAWLEAPVRLLQILILAAVGTGCHVLPAMPPVVQDMGPRYHPSNVYRPSAFLPPHLRRVALLPLVSQESTAFLQAGLETLSPLVYAELEKCKRFEVIAVSADQLRQWTGKSNWRADEPLPSNFFARMAEATGCDAVLFCQLTRYQPYQPIAVGWKFVLIVDPAHTPPTPAETKDSILWSADEVLDAGEPGVANSARDYYSHHLRDENPSADPSTILNSPLRFGQYSLASLLETLPVHYVPPK